MLDVVDLPCFAPVIPVNSRRGSRCVKGVHWGQVAFIFLVQGFWASDGRVDAETGGAYGYDAHVGAGLGGFGAELDRSVFAGGVERARHVSRDQTAKDAGDDSARFRHGEMVPEDGPGYQARMNDVLRCYYTALLAGHIKGHWNNDVTPRLPVEAERLRKELTGEA